MHINVSWQQLTEERDWSSKTLAHHTTVENLGKILTQGVVRAGGRALTPEEHGQGFFPSVAFSVHPHWAHVATGEAAGPVLMLKRAPIEQRHTLTKPEYTATNLERAALLTHHVGVPVQVRRRISTSHGHERLNRHYGPWEGELRANDDVHFAPHEVSHILFHHPAQNTTNSGDRQRGLPRNVDQELESTSAIARRHGVPLVVATPSMKNAKRLREKYPHLEGRIYQTARGARTWADSDLANDYGAGFVQAMKAEREARFQRWHQKWVQRKP